MSQTQKNEHQKENLPPQKTSNEESTSQYQIRPSIGKSFPIAAIREIINEVLLQILDGKKKNDRFPHNFSIFVTNFLSQKHLGKEYNSKEVGSLCKQIVNDVNRRIKDLGIPRYKHIVQIMLSEQTGAGCRYGNLLID